MKRWVGMLLLCVWLPSGAPARDRGADGEFEERRSSHFVLLQDVDIDRSSGLYGSVRFEKEVLQVLEAAHDELGERLGLRPARPVTVWIYDPGVFDAQFNGLFRFPAAGFYGGAIRVRGDSRLTQRVARTLHHELVHAAFDQAAPSYALPGWINEGVAEWFENRATGKRYLSQGEWDYLQRADAAGAWIPLSQLSVPSFGGVPPQLAGLAYLQSYAAIDYLARRRGDDGLARFIGNLLRLRNVERALKRSYRMGVDDLEEAVRAQLR